MKKSELRCYTFTIFQLSPIQQGIQAGHAAIELCTKHNLGTLPGEMVRDWARNHKTMVCLNGGQVADVLDLVQFLDSDENPYPWAPFVEDEDFLASITTSVAIVLPARIYEAAGVIRSSSSVRDSVVRHDPMMGVHRVQMTPPGIVPPEIETFSEWEFELIRRMNASALAR